MDYLSRESSPISTELWGEIDSAVVGAVRKVLSGRRFLHVFGPLGVGTESISVDSAGAVEEVSDGGIITTKGRKYVEIPAIYHDFTLRARDLENSAQFGYPVDLTEALNAAETCARKEDSLIYFGNAALGYEGLLTAQGINKIKKSDWKEGENAYSDIASAIELLISKGIYGAYTLVISPDIYLQLQRIQPGTGVLEYDRISKLLNGNVLHTPVLGSGKALLVCSEPRNLDLVIGQDLSTAYLEQKDLNHNFRVLETVLLRIKNKDAVVAFE
ncbi:MAG: family 1 encapsulin nanocompartment shell protein [Clostridiales bacterium]|nr:family 1 encapsulin nanocompartment shell protein [Clostridiales bacterium]